MSAYGHVIIGCKINNKKLDAILEKIQADSKKIEKGCSHEFLDSYKFCPECGAKTKVCTQDEEMGKTEFLETLGFSYSKGTLVATTEEEDLFVTTCSSYLKETNDIESNGGYDGIKFPINFDSIASELEKTLNPYGLWEPKNFQIWVIGCYL